MAQRIYKTGTPPTDKIILDMTVAAGMPAGAVTSTPKYNAAYLLANPPMSLGIMADNLHTGAINATVYQKLEIAPQDLGTSGLNSGTMTMHWVTAFSECKNLNHNGTGWRLPTQRELLMMWIFRTKINDLSGTPFVATYYWSATQIDNASSWILFFATGAMFDVLREDLLNRTRCVREL